MKAVAIKPEGSLAILEFKKKDFGDVLRDVIGGRFDCISLPEMGIDIWVHDEGLLLGLDRNRFAEILWETEHEESGTAYIVGPIVLTGLPDEEGNVTSISEEFIEKVINPAISHLTGKFEHQEESN
jgi:hypothetical protein